MDVTSVIVDVITSIMDAMATSMDATNSITFDPSEGMDEPTLSEGEAT